MIVFVGGLLNADVKQTSGAWNCFVFFDGGITLKKNKKQYFLF